MAESGFANDGIRPMLVELESFRIDTSIPGQLEKMVAVMYQMGRIGLVQQLMKSVRSEEPANFRKIISLLQAEREKEQRSILQYRFEKQSGSEMREWVQHPDVNSFVPSEHLVDQKLGKPQGPVSIHGKSVALFRAATFGQAFTGVVNIYHPGKATHKLYLMPVAPNSTGRIPTRAHDSATASTIYGSSQQGVITHHDPAQDNELLKMSHIMLRDMMLKASPTKASVHETKLDSWMERNPDFKLMVEAELARSGLKDRHSAARRFMQLHSVGFTVIFRNDGSGHSFNFTSSSQNNMTFQIADKYKDQYKIEFKTPTREWADAIIAAVDNIPLS